MTPLILLSMLTAATVSVAADTTPYVVLNHGRPAGEMLVIRDGESVIVQYRHVDRNRGQRVENRYRIGPDGRILFGESRPVGLNDGVPGEVADRFEVVRDSVRWGGGRGQPGGAPMTPDAWYRLRAAGTPYETALLAAFLSRQPGRTAKLLPSGTARLEIVADTTVTIRGARQRVRLAMIHSGGSIPSAVWIDDRGNLVASEVAWFMTVRPGIESVLPVLRAKELAYRNAQGAALARKLAPRATSALVIRDGDVFDAERGVMRPRTTVVIRGDRIVAVGPADSITIPAGATVIDASGKAVVPGLWEMHAHLQLTSQSAGSPMQLSLGITTVRDLAADIDVAVSHRDRAATGAILSPREILAGFMEGPGAWAGPSEVIVRTEAEARAWVARYDSLGYKQIKLYNIIHPDLVPTIAAEAHKRGMRLSGHVPRGLSVPAAVKLGFDEINHAAFLFSSFYQDSLYLPTMRAYSAVATAVAPNIDVESREMTAMIDVLKENHTVVDGTFSLWVQAGGGGRGGGAGPATPNATVEKANANYLRLIKRLYDAGVTMVAGTDNGSSSSYNTELEIYERAGVPAAQVLQMATIVSARVMKDDRDYGSIAPGKVADLVIIDGRPAERIADLRNVNRVVRAGRAYVPQEIVAAVRGTPPS
jgi:imidazolonepropionase-like amidohydrolase